MRFKAFYQKVILMIIAGLLSLAGSVRAQQTLGAYTTGAACTFNTSAEAAAGCTSSDYLTVQYGGFVNGQTLASGWTLRVKANGNFSNGSATIDPSYVALRFGSAPTGPKGVSNTGFQTLSAAPKALISTKNPIVTPDMYYFEHKFDLRITGGAHLIAGTGTFTGTVTIELVSSTGTVLATKSDVSLSFVVNYSNTCQGAAISSYSNNQYSFTTYAQQMAGSTVTDALTIQYAPNGSTCSGWSVKMRAASNFVNGANSVAPQYFSFRFNRVSVGRPTAANMGVNTTPKTLSTADVALISQSQAGFSGGTEHKFDMLIQGGNHLLVPNGTYTGSVILSLYNQNNELVSSVTVQISFAVNSSSNTFTVELQNTANDINLVFNTVADLNNGVSVDKARGLKITGYNPYQVLIKTSAVNLTGSDNSTIPVGVVNVQPTKYTTSSGGISVFTRTLSTADQIIITNPMVDYTQQSVEYNLRYYTNPADSRLSGKSGVFNTSVLFVVIPQ